MKATEHETLGDLMNAARDVLTHKPHIQIPRQLRIKLFDAMTRAQITFHHKAQVATAEIEGMLAAAHGALDEVEATDAFADKHGRIPDVNEARELFLARIGR